MSWELHRVRSAAAALVVASCVVACDAILGVEILPPAVQFQFASAPCGACTEASCASERDGCRADQACVTLEACVATCSADDLVCRGRCDSAHPDGVHGDAFGKLDTCQRAKCAEECVASGRGVFSTLWGADCGSCADPKCADVLKACSKVPRCDEFLYCAVENPIPDPEHLRECSFAFEKGDPGTDPVVAVEHCVQGPASACASCPIGRDWDCVGNYSYSFGQDVPIPLHVTIMNILDRGIEGVRVRACPAAACGLGPDLCGTSTVPTTTDKAGVADVSVPAPNGQFVGCLVLSGGGIVPELFYFARPVIRAESPIITALDPVLVTTVGLPQVCGSDTHCSDFSATGIVGMSPIDCARASAKGVHIDKPANASSLAYIIGNAQLDTNATETDGNGALLAGVEPGMVTIVAHDGLDGPVVAHQTVTVVAGTYTTTFLPPDTAP